MRRTLVLLAVSAIVKPALSQISITPREGLVISRTIAFRPGVYRIKARASLDSAAIVVRGSNITLDFNGVQLEGAPAHTDPDHAAGAAILVDSGSDVTIK